MQPDSEILDFLLQHLQSIQENNLDAYHATTHSDLTLYEWWITPHRIDGLPFHDCMMVFGAEVPPGMSGEATRTRSDLANLKIQRYGDTAIASYTLLNSSATPQGVRVAAHNETRVMVRLDGGWKVVHVHKTPAWPAPHVAPE
jgi:hypothetical protein